MKYIDAELLQKEIERLKSKYRHNGLWTSSLQSDLAMAKIESMNELLSFLDTLPDESEQPTRGYDEAYLNEKIDKASKSWEGVDVDKFMDEIRGREPVTDCHDLEDEIDRVIADYSSTKTIDSGGFKTTVLDYEKIARHFAEWGAEHLRDSTKKISEDLEEAAEAYSRQVSRGHNYRDLTCGFIAGAKWQKEQETREMIMSDGSYFQKCYELGKKDMKEQMIEGAVEGEVQEFYRDEDGIHCCVSVGTDYKPGTIVYVITIPKEEGQ